GTRFTMQSSMFGDEFRKRGVEIVVPSGDDQQVVHDVIYDELGHGVVSDSARSTYLAVIDKLIAEGAQAVVLACTEQGLLLKDGDAPVPLIDTTEVHCRALVRFLLGEDE